MSWYGNAVYIVGVQEHKNSSHKLAFIALLHEEKHLMDVYMHHCRDKLLACSRYNPNNPRSVYCDEDMTVNQFIINSHGLHIHNASNDLAKYPLDNYVAKVNNTTVCHIAEHHNVHRRDIPEGDMRNVSEYLTHTLV